MKTTQNCLQEMVDAIKGVEPNEVAENKTTQTLLREIADAINNETTTDEGKNTQTLLGDITEAIRESGGGSGGETFEVTFTINIPADGPLTVTSATKTYAELMAALNSGKTLVPVFDFTYPEGVVIPSVTVGDGFINNSNDIYVACKITVEESGTTIGAYIIVSWFNPETHTNEFGISFYNG